MRATALFLACLVCGSVVLCSTVPCFSFFEPGVELEGGGVPVPPTPQNEACHPPVQHTDFLLTVCNSTIFVETTDLDMSSASAASLLAEQHHNMVFLLDTLTISLIKPWRLVGRNLWIIAKKVMWGSGVVIDLSGEKGPNDCHGCPPPPVPTGDDRDGIPGIDGSPGQSGGKFVLVAQSIEASTPITIISNGADGGNGQPGGNGAQGLHGPSGSGNSPGGRGHKGGNGGRGGAGGDGGSGGSSLIFLEQESPRSLFKFSSTPGKVGVPGISGKPGAGGVGGSGGTYKKCHRKWYGVKDCKEKYAGDGPSGPPGNPAPPVDHRPVPGHVGSTEFQKLNMTDLFSLMTTTELQFLVDQADDLYLSNDFSSARDHYLFIFQILNSSLPILNQTTLQEDQLSDSTRRLYGFVPEGSSISPGELRMREAMRSHCLVQLQTIRAGKDYFCVSAGSCPPFRVGAYSNMVEGALNTAMLMQQEFLRLQSQTDALSEKQNAYNQICSQSKQKISELTVNINKRTASIATIATKINDMISTADHLQNNVVMESAACMTAMFHEIEERFLLSSVGVALNIVGSMVTMGADIGNLFDSFKNLLKAGENLGKAFSTTGTLIKSSSDLTDAAQSALDSGKAIVDDFKKNMEGVQDFSHKMVVTEKSFNSFIGPLLNLKECQDLKDVFHKFINLRKTINSLSVSHDTLVLQNLRDEVAIQTAQAQIDAAVDASVEQTFNPALFQTMMLAQKIYKQSKVEVVQYLNEFRRAHFCNTMDDYRPVYFLDSVEQLAFTFQLMKSFQTSVMEQRAFRTGNFLFADRELVFNGSNTPLFDGFRETGVLNVTMLPGHPSFAPLVNVHMTNFRVCVPGARTNSGRLHLMIFRPGATLNRNSVGQLFNFVQDPSYYLQVVDSDCRDISGLDFAVSSQLMFTSSESVSGGMSQTFELEVAHTSPFSAWIIAAPSELNPGLDLSGVEEVVIQMSGSFEAMTQPSLVPGIYGGPLSNSTSFYGGGEGSSSPEDSGWSQGEVVGFWVGISGGTLVIVATVVVVLVVRRRRLRRRHPLEKESIFQGIQYAGVR